MNGNSCLREQQRLLLEREQASVPGAAWNLRRANWD